MTNPLFSADDEKVEKSLAVLSRMPKYPFEDSVDRALVRKLIDQFPTVDVYWEIEKWAMWMSEHTTKKKVMYRARLGAWVQRARTFQDRSPAGSFVKGKAEAAEVHGETSDRLEQW